jgi:hypothetical protein
MFCCFFCVNCFPSISKFVKLGKASKNYNALIQLTSAFFLSFSHRLFTSCGTSCFLTGRVDILTDLPDEQSIKYVSAKLYCQRHKVLACVEKQKDRFACPSSKQERDSCLFDCRLLSVSSACNGKRFIFCNCWMSQ